MPAYCQTASEISTQELVNKLEQFEVRQTVDLGSTLLQIGVHVYDGPMLLVSTMCGRAAMIAL